MEKQEIPLKERMTSRVREHFSDTSSYNDVIDICAAVAEEEILDAYFHGREMGKRVSSAMITGR